MKSSSLQFAIVLRIAIFFALLSALVSQTGSPVFYDFRDESPGKVHKISVNDLPPPNATKSANNFPEPHERPAGAMPKTLPGFKVDLYTTGLDEPRELRAAPNGDVFL